MKFYNCIQQIKTARNELRRINQMHSQQFLVSNRIIAAAIVRLEIEFISICRFISLCGCSESWPSEASANRIYYYRIWSRHVSSAIRLFTYRQLSTHVSNDSGTDMCRWALWLAGALASLLSSRQTIPQDRHHLFDAGLVGKLLLALHVSLRACQHDFGFRRNQKLCLVPDNRLPQPEREHGADDNVSQLGDTGSA